MTKQSPNSWAEKYRPTSLNGAEISVAKELKNICDNKMATNIMLWGPPGTGKTSLAISFAKDLLGNGFASNFLELNASDERGIDVIRSKIKLFSQLRPSGSDFKVIFLDESDNITRDAQNALRRIMEKSISTIYIFAINDFSKIIEALKSRCHCFNLPYLSQRSFTSIIKKILSGEKIDFDEKYIDSLWKETKGDLRKAINLSERFSKTSNNLDSKLFALSKQNLNLWYSSISKKTLSQLVIGLKKLIDQGINYSSILQYIFHMEMEKKIPRDSVIRTLADVDFRITEGSNPLIQVIWLVNILKNLK